MRQPAPVIVPDEDRQRHTYITGGSGAGKSELMKLLIQSAVHDEQGSAVVVVDSHGDLVRQVAHWPEFITPDRLVYFDPFLYPDRVPIINPLDATGLDDYGKEMAASEMVAVFGQLIDGNLSDTMQAMLYPCLLVLMNRPNSTLADLQDFMNDDANKALVDLGRKSKTQAVAQFFTRGFVGPQAFSSTKVAIFQKIQSLRNNEAFDRVVSGRSTLNLENLIDERKVILFDLAKGRLGSAASEALGRFILAKIQGIALRRATTERKSRVPVQLFVDECQNYVGPAIQTLLEEARKFGIHLTLAQQVAGRGMSPELTKAVLNNTQVKFAGKSADDKIMADIMGVEFEEVQQLDKGQFFCRTGSKPAFRMQTSIRRLDDKTAMNAENWQGALTHMLHYYRKLKKGEGKLDPRPRELI